MDSRHSALVADSCFSGDMLNPKGSTAPIITDEYFKKAYSRISRQALTSGALEPVPDASSFAQQLKLALKGNNQPYLDPHLLYGEIRLGVRGTTPLFGTLKGSGHQDGASFLFFLRDEPGDSVAARQPERKQSFAVEKAYGSIKVEVKTAGTFYLDGIRQGPIPAEGAARLSDLETGSHSLEMHYDDGQNESKRATVLKDKTILVAFSYIERPKAPEGHVLVKDGTFSMGSTTGDSDEKPVHSVTISKAFYMSKYEVTQGKWREVMGTNPSHFKGDSRPVESVSWYDAVEYCNRLSRKEGLSPCYSGSGDSIRCDFSANGYRLPSEAEWEYAARGGNKGRSYTYAGSSSVGDVGWYDGNSGGKTHEVGRKKANELGLYDMSGNVYEWCWDWWGDYSSSSQTDPRGPSWGSYRVFRGGGRRLSAASLRAANRGNNTLSLRSSYLGFRPLRTVE